MSHSIGVVPLEKFVSSSTSVQVFRLGWFAYSGTRNTESPSEPSHGPSISRSSSEACCHPVSLVDTWTSM